MGKLACERSGHCSLGKTKPYVGEVDSALGLRAALASRSYKREAILMATDSERMLPAMQAVSNLLRLGLEHVLMSSSSGPDCVRVAAAMPATGCVWLDFELPVFGAEREYVVAAVPMWHNRYRLAARIIRMRYNIFLVDTDVIFFDDPYLYFKSPPFANFTIINQPEVLYDQEDYFAETEPNGGVIYIQNAAPDGPAAWLLSEVVDRLLRWVEDGFNLTRQTHSLASWCNYMDQDGLRDAITSVRLGRIFFGATIRDCRLEGWRATHGSEHEALLAASEALLGAPDSSFRLDAVQLPASMAAVANAAAVEVRHFTMRLPAYVPWDTKYGPYLYPEHRGLLSRQWVKQLKEDCDCPLWPDPEDPAAAPAAAVIAPERYLLAPPFLALNWFARGRLGYWYRALTGGAPQQVVGHLHYIPGTGASVGKTVARMAVGHYDWAMARQVLGPRMYFLHQGGSPIQSGSESVLGGGPAPLHLLAYHPSLLAALGATRSWREYSELLAALAMTAFALKRVPVWPDVPCAAHWVADGIPQAASSLPLKIRQEFIPYGRRRNQMSCVWLPLLNEPCLYGGRGMLSLEFSHWRAQMRMLPSLEPGEENTIGVPTAALSPAGPAANATPSGRIFNLALDEVTRAWSLRKTHVHRVLYLLNPVNVTYPAASEDTFLMWQALADCRATNPEDVEQDLVDKPFKSPVPPTLAFVPAGLTANGLIRPSPAIPGYNVPDPKPPAPRGMQDHRAAALTAAAAAAAGSRKHHEHTSASGHGRHSGGGGGVAAGGGDASGSSGHGGSSSGGGGSAKAPVALSPAAAGAVGSTTSATAAVAAVAPAQTVAQILETSSARTASAAIAAAASNAVAGGAIGGVNDLAVTAVPTSNALNVLARTAIDPATGAAAASVAASSTGAAGGFSAPSSTGTSPAAALTRTASATGASATGIPSASTPLAAAAGGASGPTPGAAGAVLGAAMPGALAYGALALGTGGSGAVTTPGQFIAGDSSSGSAHATGVNAIAVAAPAVAGQAGIAATATTPGAVSGSVLVSGATGAVGSAASVSTAAGSTAEGVAAATAGSVVLAAGGNSNSGTAAASAAVPATAAAPVQSGSPGNPTLAPASSSTTAAAAASTTNNAHSSTAASTIPSSGAYGTLPSTAAAATVGTALVGSGVDASSASGGGGGGSGGSAAAAMTLPAASTGSGATSGGTAPAVALPVTAAAMDSARAPAAATTATTANGATTALSLDVHGGADTQGVSTAARSAGAAAVSGLVAGAGSGAGADATLSSASRSGQASEVGAAGGAAAAGSIPNDGHATAAAIAAAAAAAASAADAANAAIATAAAAGGGGGTASIGGVGATGTNNGGVGAASSDTTIGQGGGGAMLFAGDGGRVDAAAGGGGADRVERIGGLWEGGAAGSGRLGGMGGGAVGAGLGLGQGEVRQRPWRVAGGTGGGGAGRFRGGGVDTAGGGVGGGGGLGGEVRRFPGRRGKRGQGAGRGGGFRDFETAALGFEDAAAAGTGGSVAGFGGGGGGFAVDAGALHDGDAGAGALGGGNGELGGGGGAIGAL